jgi:hypothetical protein
MSKIAPKQGVQLPPKRKGRAKVTMAEARQALMDNVTVRVWPEAAVLLQYERDAAYSAARNGHIPTIRMGRMLRVPTAALRKMLGIEQASAA